MSDYMLYNLRGINEHQAGARQGDCAAGAAGNRINFTLHAAVVG